MVSETGLRTGDGGRGHQPPARLPELALSLNLGHEAVRGAGRQVAQRQLAVLRHQRARQLALEDARRLRRLQRARLRMRTCSWSRDAVSGARGHAQV